MILAIGCRFSDIHCSSWVPGYTYNIPPTKLIHVDLDPQEIGRNYPTELGIIGDAREVLRQLNELAGPRAEAGALAVDRPGRGVEGGVVELHRAREGERRDADRPAARDRGAAQGGAGRHADDHRHRQPPDLGRAVLGRLRAAVGVHARRVRRHGLRHVRRPRASSSPGPTGRRSASPATAAS